MRLQSVDLDNLFYSNAILQPQHDSVKFTLKEKEGEVVRFVLYPDELVAGILFAMRNGWNPELGFRILSWED